MSPDNHHQPQIDNPDAAPATHSTNIPDSFEPTSQFGSLPQEQPKPQSAPSLFIPEAPKEAPKPSVSEEPPKPAPSLANVPLSDEPVAVVKTYSIRGIEYGMMTLSLLFAASSLTSILISLINGGTSVSILAFPIALLITALPIFIFFFIRLKKAERINPALKFEASRRRFAQFMTFLTFLTCLFSIATFVYLVISKFTNNGSQPFIKSTEDIVVILAIAGGIFAYYWLSEHRFSKKSK